MKSTNLIVFCSLVAASFSCTAQNLPEPPKYSHKIVVDSVLHTRAYTYMFTKEKIGDRDSSVWLAMPYFPITAGQTFYYDHGLPMGQFRSKELDRTFEQIIFISNLSTSEAYSDSTLIPPMFKDTVTVKPPPPFKHSVVVKEVVQSGGYTYLRTMEADTERWLAVVRIPAKVGQVYTYTDAAKMKNFTSRELNRTFDEVYFIAKLTYKSEDSGISQDVKSNAKIKPTPIMKLIDQKSKYEGKIVRVTGKVVKYSENILDKNWIHLDDQSGPTGLSDIAATTTDEVKIGDQVTLEGKLVLNRDFGSGYFFEVLIEGAKVLR